MWFYIPLSSNYKLSSLGKMWWVQLRVIYSYGLSNFFHTHLQNICHNFPLLPTAPILRLRWLLLRYATKLLISGFTYYRSRDRHGLKLQLDWCREACKKKEKKGLFRFAFSFQISHNDSSGYFLWNFFFSLYLCIAFFATAISTVTRLVSHSLVALPLLCFSDELF